MLRTFTRQKSLGGAVPRGYEKGGEDVANVAVNPSRVKLQVGAAADEGDHTTRRCCLCLNSSATIVDPDNRWARRHLSRSGDMTLWLVP